MTDNIIPLHSVKISRPPNEEAIQLLETYLKAAKEGDLACVGIAVVYTDHVAGGAWCIDEEDVPVTLLSGSVAVLQHRLINLALENMEVLDRD